MKQRKKLKKMNRASVSCGTTSDNCIRNWRLYKVGKEEKENIFEEIMVGNFPNLNKNSKHTNPRISRSLKP